MRILFVTISLLITSIASGQFKVSTVQKRDKTEKKAESNSISKLPFTEPSFIRLEKILANELVISFYYCDGDPMNEPQVEECEMAFVFYDSRMNKKHTYYTTTGGSKKYGKGHLLFLFDDNLIKFFKKYSYVEAYIDSQSGVFNKGNWMYKFSLKGFTSACKELLK